MQNQEIKGNLAKLLATENLLVEHRKVNTASFDVDGRVLTLPKWDKASSTVYDLLVGHEVGHALYTPIWRDFKCPKDYVNVTEDARIEKLMKRRYPGLRKSFYNGYAELNDSDFFGIDGEDLNTFKLIDRINLYFKIGFNSIDIQFTPEEKVLVDETEDAETFDQAVAVAEKLWALAKEQQKELESLANVPQSGGDGGGTTSEMESDETSSDAMTHEEMLEEAERRENENGASPAGGDINTSDTQQNFNDSTADLNSEGYHGSNVYVNIPRVDCSDYIVDWTVIHNWIDTNNTEQDDHEHVDNLYRQFKNSITKEVNYLVKEFECKKAADSYSRAQTSRTGVLATDRLHTYKYNEDLFKKVTIIPEGKNHGMLFLLDWSGSMSTEMLPTIKQLILLTNFCKKVGIPFEVYAFTNEWIVAERAINCNNYPAEYEKPIEGTMIVSKDYFRMMNILSSRSSTKQYDIQCKNIFREVYSMLYYSTFNSTPGMGLSGTPLNEAIVVMSSIISKFKKQTGCQKVNLCVLTDGEACMSSYGAVMYQYDTEMVRAKRIDYYNVILRDVTTGTVYKKQPEYTNVLIQNLKDRNPGCNVIGFRYIGSGGLSNFYNSYCDGGKFDIVQKQWKKEKSAILPDPIAFSSLYVISTKTIDMEENVMEVEAGSSKVAVKSALNKMLNKKKSNKKILSSFIKHVS